MSTNETFPVFWKLLKKLGYPNPRLRQIAEITNYDLINFVEDLIKTFGEKQTFEFLKKTIKKNQPDGGFRFELEGGQNEYVQIKVEPKFITEEGFLEVTFTWGEDSRIVVVRTDDVEEVKTIQKVLDDWEPGDDVEDFINSLIHTYKDDFFNNFGIQLSEY
jgi:DNA-binding ferritin-like protein (Dps family)